MSDIQGYEKYIIKKETLCTNPPINIYINGIDNRLALKKMMDITIDEAIDETMDETFF